MSDLVGKTIDIAGMVVEIIADRDQKWECRNRTTGETIQMDKAMIERAIKLGKAEFLDGGN